MKAAYSRAQPWNYSMLKARTAELGKTDRDVAVAGKMTPSTYSLKVNGKGEFSQEQISDICQFLGIDFSEIPRYFFAL
ncbi:DUF739 family protein [uncultured Oscillibacter sp.]|uniref:DUF739 family protein n=1 Tax=uncultured Oscillibacter sp. TaxID=876091 RepID=UPI00261B78E1|nr:DUF739 family protein [uncultured Oscillibacter sp.]